MDNNKYEPLIMVREYLGKGKKMSQAMFAEWLADHGAYGSDNNIYSEKTIAAWENKRRNPPDSVLKVVQENVLYEGHKLKWDYLKGKTKYKTDHEIIMESLKILNQSDPTLVDLAMKKRLQERKAEILFEFALSLSGYDRTDITDWQHYSAYMNNSVINIVEKYMENNNQRKEAKK